MQNESFKLILGDCLEVMKGFENKSIDLIFCDLPYGTTKCSWDVVIPFEPLWREYKRILKDKGTILLFGSEPFASVLRTSNLSWYKYDWIWAKNNAGNFQLANEQPLKIHETISVFQNKEIVSKVFSDIIIKQMQRLNLKQRDVSKLELSRNGKQTGWVSNKIKGTQLPTRNQWAKMCELFGIADEYDKLLSKIEYHQYNLTLSDVNIVQSNVGKAGRLGHLSSIHKRTSYVQTKKGYPKSILYFQRESGSFETQKPIPLLEYLIKIYSSEGNIVLDNCMGSGSTGIAALNLRRNFIGIEKNARHFELAKSRIENNLTIKL